MVGVDAHAAGRSGDPPHRLRESITRLPSACAARIEIELRAADEAAVLGAAGGVDQALERPGRRLVARPSGCRRGRAAARRRAARTRTPTRSRGRAGCARRSRGVCAPCRSRTSGCPTRRRSPRSTARRAGRSGPSRRARASTVASWPTAVGSGGIGAERARWRVRRQLAVLVEQVVALVVGLEGARRRAAWPAPRCGPGSGRSTARRPRRPCRARAWWLSVRPPTRSRASSTMRRAAGGLEMARAAVRPASPAPTMITSALWLRSARALGACALRLLGGQRRGSGRGRGRADQRAPADARRCVGHVLRHSGVRRTICDAAAGLALPLVHGGDRSPGAVVSARSAPARARPSARAPCARLLRPPHAPAILSLDPRRGAPRGVRDAVQAGGAAASSATPRSAPRSTACCAATCCRTWLAAGPTSSSSTRTSGLATLGIGSRGASAREPVRPSRTPPAAGGGRRARRSARCRSSPPPMRGPLAAYKARFPSLGGLDQAFVAGHRHDRPQLHGHVLGAGQALSRST